jgi:FdhE protein
VSLLNRLREIHRVVRDARARVEPLQLDPGTARARLEAGRPLLAGTSVPVDADVADRILEEICGSLCTPEAIRLRTSAQGKRLAFQAAADAILSGRDHGLAEERAVPAPFLDFVLMSALRPSFRRHAESLQPLIEEMRWHRAVCPICGSVPALAELRGSPGRRYLRCALCEGAWWVPRLRCPFCGTTDHNQLRYLRIEIDPAMRLDLCDACGRYLKTRILPGGEAETDPFGWDLATLHLDALAWDQGFFGPWAGGATWDQSVLVTGRDVRDHAARPHCLPPL